MSLLYFLALKKKEKRKMSNYMKKKTFDWIRKKRTCMKTKHKKNKINEFCGLCFLMTVLHTFPLSTELYGFLVSYWSVERMSHTKLKLISLDYGYKALHYSHIFFSELKRIN